MIQRLKSEWAFVDDEAVINAGYGDFGDRGLPLTNTHDHMANVPI